MSPNKRSHTRERIEAVRSGLGPKSNSVFKKVRTQNIEDVLDVIVPRLRSEFPMDNEIHDELLAADLQKIMPDLKTYTAIELLELANIEAEKNGGKK